MVVVQGEQTTSGEAMRHGAETEIYGITGASVNQIKLGKRSHG